MPRQTPLANHKSFHLSSRLRRPAFERLEQREMLAFSVAAADVFFSANYKLIVDFNAAVANATVTASDVKVDGVSASSFVVVDADTYEFVLPTLAAGTRSVSIAAGAISSSALNEPIDAFNKSVVVASASQYTIKYNPRLQPGNASLTSAVVNGSVVNYVGGDKDRVDLIWETVAGSTGNQDSFTTQYRLAGSNAAWQSGTPTTSVSTGVGGRIVHSSSITGLEWNTNYEYRVFHRQGDVVVRVFAATFKTRLVQGDKTPFTFAAYGDSADITLGADGHQLVQGRINTVNPAFTVLLGDNVYSSGTHAEMDARFDPTINPEAAAWMATHIDYLGLGNHDNVTGNALPSQQLYSVPIQVAGVNAPATAPTLSTSGAVDANATEHNFSWDYGDVHFVTFDTDKWQTSGKNSAVLNAQLDYVIADLNASTARWKIVYGHHPVAGVPDKSEAPGDYYYQQVVSRLLGAGVDLFMTGHSHTYAWTYPLTGQVAGTATYVDRGDYDYFYHQDGLPQLVSGLGGRDVRSGSFASYPFVAAGFTSNSTTSPTGRLGEFGFSLVEVTQDQLTVKYVAADDGQVIDQFAITKAVPALTDTVTFQQGLHGYAGTTDTYVALTTPTTSNAASAILNMDTADPNGNPTQALLRFGDLFGTGSGQIPPTATITSASLQIYVSNTSTTSGNGITLNRMVSEWTDTATWNSLSGGIQTDNLEAASTPDITTGIISTLNAYRSIDVLTSLQAWQTNPDSNKGWALLPTGTDGLDFHSSEGANPPQLVVRYIVDGNVAPVAYDDVVNISKNAAQAIAVLTNDQDVNGDTLSVASVTTPTHGNVVVNANGTITYTPALNYVGSDSFTYTISDGLGLVSTAIVSLTVAPPATTVTFKQGVNGYTGTVDTSVRDNATTTANGTGTILLVDGASPISHGLVRFDNLFGTGAGRIPSANVTITSATLTLSVSNTGDALTAHRMVTTWADTATWSTLVSGVQANGTEALATADATSISTVGQPASTASPLALTMDVTTSLTNWLANPGTNFGWTILPTAGDGVQFDSAEGTSPPSLTVTYLVTAQVPPTAQNDLIATQRNVAVSIPILANDADANGDLISLAGTTAPANGKIVVNSDNTVTYIPNVGYAGSDTFTYTISDGSSSAVGTVNITVALPTATAVFQQGVAGYSGAVDTHLRDDQPTTNLGTSTSLSVDNQGPVAHGLLRFNNLFGAGTGQVPTTATLQSATLTVYATNLSVNPINVHRMAMSWSDTATWTTTGQAPFNTSAGIQTTGVEAFNAIDTTFTVSTINAFTSADVLTSVQQWQTTPSSNFGWALLPTGVDGVIFDSAEGATISQRPSLTIVYIVPSTNTPPAAQNDAIATTVGVAATFNVRTNDTDADGDTLTVQSFSRPLHGTVVLNGSNQLVYTPEAGYLGADSFEYVVSDGNGGAAAATVNITIQPPNQPPQAITLAGGTVAEGVDNVFVGTFSALDPNAGDTHTYTTTDNRFEIVGNQLRLLAGQAFNFETSPSVSVSVTVTDNGSPAFALTQSVLVTVTNVNEAPTNIALTGSTISENQAGVTIGQLSAIDPDAGSTHAFTTNDSRFTIVGNQLQLAAGQSFDFEATPTVAVSITATDNGTPALGWTQLVTITVANVNEVPTAITLNGNTVLENSVAAVIGTLSATDPDTGSTLAYSSTDGRFQIVGNELRLAPGQSLNYETASSIHVPITATDNGSPPLSLTQSVTVQVLNVAEPPSDLTLSRNKVISGIAGAWVALLATVDTEGSAGHTYSFSDTRFEIRDGSLFLNAESSVLVTEAIVSLTITAHDGAMSFSKVFSLGVESAPVGWSSAHQWRLLPADVNADGFVAPLDALLIIIDLNSGGARHLSSAASGTRAPLFVDVSGDGFLAPDDALGVINWLNAEGVGAGEFVGTETIASETTATSAIRSAPQWIALESRVAGRVLGVTSDDVWKMAFEQVERERYWRFDPLVLDVEYVRDGAAEDDAVPELFDLLWADEVR